jgi:hypothetical protein
MPRGKRQEHVAGQLAATRQNGRRSKTPLVVACGMTLIVLLVVVAAAPRWFDFVRDAGPSARQKPQMAKLTDPDSISRPEAIPDFSSRPWQELDDPVRDGWDSEVFSAKADEQLKKLAKLLDRGERIDAAALSSLAADDFSCGPLRPENLVTVFRDRTLWVQRADNANESIPRGSARPYHKTEGLADALQALARPFQGASEPRTELKLYRVTPSSDAVTTRHYFAMSGRAGDSLMELHATWVIRWSTSPADTEPRLASIGVEDFEQVRTLGTPTTFFSDCTESVLASNPCYRTQLLRGLNHWLERSQDHRFNFLLGNPGVAVGDANGDGLDDLYVCQEAGLPNRLFLQQPDGTATDVSEWAGVNWLENSKCALLVDLDNDGDQDLAVAIEGGVALAANDGQAKFALRTVLDTSDDVLSLTAADYDRDGRLDLYAGVYHASRAPDESQDAAIPAASAGVVYHDANSGGPNSLFRNQTNNPDVWQFTEVTQEVGLDNNNRRFTLAAAWEDFDNDGDQDLYVANDFGRNNLYRNDVSADGQHRFVDIAASAGAEDSASGMSVTWGDYDRDGWMDVYVSNMFSSAGNRIAFQDRFKAEAPEYVKTRLQRFARGNTLLRNAGTGVFSDVSEAAAVTMGRWAWSSNFVDLNNDGWEDLIVANGYITTDDTSDL